MKNKSTTLFLDLSHDLAWRILPPTKPSQHCTVDIYAAVIPESMHNVSLVHASYCQCVCVVMNQRASGAGEHTRLPQCMLQNSTESLHNQLVLPSSCVHVSPHFSWCEVKDWSTVQQWIHLQKQLRTQKRQQVNIQHNKTPRYSSK